MAEKESGNGETPGANDGAGNQTDGKSTAEQAGKKSTDAKDDSAGDGKIVFDSKKDRDDYVNSIVTARLAREKKTAEETAKLSETQKLEKERDDANKKAAESDLKDNFILANSDMGYATALKMFRYYRNDLDVDSAGKIVNLDDIKKTMRLDFKELFPARVKGKSDGGNGGNKAPASASMDSFLRTKN